MGNDGIYKQGETLDYPLHSINFMALLREFPKNGHFDRIADSHVQPNT